MNIQIQCILHSALILLQYLQKCLKCLVKHITIFVSMSLAPPV